MIKKYAVNPYHANFPFLCSLKTSETRGLQGLQNIRLTLYTYQIQHFTTKYHISSYGHVIHGSAGILELVIVFFSALIQVLKPININDENKGRICLLDDDNLFARDQDCFATGCGNVQENGFPSDKLREVKVKRVSLANCNSLLSYKGRKDETMTYAGYAVGG